MPDFVTLTLVVNGAQVLLVPLLAASVWWITAQPRYIGRQHRNRWWENLMMAVLFPLFLGGAAVSLKSLISETTGLSGVQAGIEKMINGQAAGKIVVEIA